MNHDRLAVCLAIGVLGLCWVTLTYLLLHALVAVSS
jgi:hypothetical protein